MKYTKKQIQESIAHWKKVLEAVGQHIVEFCILDDYNGLPGIQTDSQIKVKFNETQFNDFLTYYVAVYSGNFGKNIDQKKAIKLINKISRKCADQFVKNGGSKVIYSKLYSDSGDSDGEITLYILNIDGKKTGLDVEQSIDYIEKNFKDNLTVAIPYAPHEEFPVDDDIHAAFAKYPSYLTVGIEGAIDHKEIVFLGNNLRDCKKSAIKFYSTQKNTNIDAMINDVDKSLNVKLDPKWLSILKNAINKRSADKFEDTYADLASYEFENDDGRQTGWLGVYVDAGQSDILVNKLSDKYADAFRLSRKQVVLPDGSTL